MLMARLYVFLSLCISNYFRVIARDHVTTEVRDAFQSRVASFQPSYSTNFYQDLPEPSRALHFLSEKMSSSDGEKFDSDSSGSESDGYEPVKKVCGFYLATNTPHDVSR